MNYLKKMLSISALIFFMGALKALIANSAETADSASDSVKGVVVETEFSLFTKGFKSSWPPGDGSVEQMIFKEISLRLSHPLSEKMELAGGYQFSSIQQSQVYVEVSRSFGKIKTWGGLNLGSLHELPLRVVPGISVQIVFPISRAISIAGYGETSIFIHPLVSLTSTGSSFDQNLLGFYIASELRDARVLTMYENENLYAVPAAGARYRNKVQTFEFSVATDLKSFWLNSTTGVGAEIAEYISGGTDYKYGGLFIEEILRFKLKKAEFFTGASMTVLNFTMADSSSFSPPRTPSFSLKAGMKIGR